MRWRSSGSRPKGSAGGTSRVSVRSGAGGGPTSSGMAGAAIRTPLPPRTLSPPAALYISGTRRRKGERISSSAEGDGGGADDQPLALVALEPDVELDRARALVLLGDGAAETDGPPREHEAAERRPQPAEHARPGPSLDETREQPHAHVAGRDHAGQALPARALVVGEAGRPLVGGPGVGPYLVLGEEELP